MPPRLPRFHMTQERLDDQRRLAKILLETGEAAPPPKPQAGATSGGDPARLRGLPAIGPSVTGATRDTDPVWALLRKESRRRR